MLTKYIRLLAMMLALCLMIPAAMAQDAVPAAPEAPAARALPIDLSAGPAPDPKGYTGTWSYEDPTISVTIEEGVVDTNVGTHKCTYWVATIRIADPSQLRTMAASDFYSNRVTKGTALAKRANAVLAINGDFYCYTGIGYIVRQGEEYLNLLEGDRDVLLIDDQGDFHPVLKPEAGSMDGTVNGRKVVNSFFFGPVLVMDGKAVENLTGVNMAHDTGRQRMALCQVGPLEYKAICCAGPARGSSGLTLQEFASLCASQGVQTAYNMDGGDSTMMIFKNEKINDVYNKSVRSIADIIYFASAREAE